ncbi:MAG: ATP-binding protein [Steroidobacteraceae bacterium]
MRDSRVKLLLFSAIFIAAAVPIAAAFYLAGDALQRSLNLGFNSQIERSLEMGSKNLKTLKRIDPSNEAQYRAEFAEIQNLTNVYAQPQLVKHSVLGSLKIYFGAGLLSAAVGAVGIATLLGRRISHSYQIAIRELLAHRERVRYLEQMASWQEMAKILAHEIKNPLTPIEVLVTSLTTSHSSKSPREFAVQLEQTQAMIQEEIGQLKRTVDRYSEFAKYPPAELVEADPVQVIEQHAPAVRAQFVSARLVVRGADAAGHWRARMDPALFRPVLMNIIGNGTEANPGREVLFTIEVSATKSAVHMNISNDGVPVPAQIAPRMFDPYVSGHGGRDNMGLGLAIVKKIVMEHEGEIAYVEVDGHPRFCISLPRVA